MFQWRKYVRNNNPNDIKVQKKLKNYLKKIRGGGRE